MNRTFKLIAGTLLAAALASAGVTVQAQQWPTKPVTMVNPFAPGGGVDAFGRPLSVYLSKTIGQQFIVENLAGAGGTVGAANAARRPGDGYNFFLGAVHHTIAESLYSKLPYSLERDFVPITVLAYVPNVVVMHPKNAQIGSIKENISIRRFARYQSPQNAVIGTYIHGGGKIGVMVEVVGVAGNSATVETAKDIAMHIAAAEPRFLSRTDVTQKDLDTEREIALDAALKSGKPQNIAEKMVAGKMEKFYAEACLLEQPYIRDDKATVTQYLQRRGKDAGCELVVTRFTRYKLGEGIEKKSEDFAAEVASYMK